MKAKYHFIVLYLERILSSDIHKAADSMYNEKMSNQNRGKQGYISTIMFHLDMVFNIKR